MVSAMTDSERAVLLDRLLEAGLPRPLALAAVEFLAAPPNVDAKQLLDAPPSEDGEGPTIDGGRRCGVYRHWDDWWVGYSPRNGIHASVEGPWEDWVLLAQQILVVEGERLNRGTP